ncbi:MAG: aminoacyl-tRNA hydrolase [SAR324 cluster bacterium]|nr:aminoacyl-tRNA hydrolase [SAR324 cluster bacterium]
MKLVVGLGNPGPVYEKNLHNAGFQMLDLLAGHLAAPPFRQKFHAEISKSSRAGQDFILMKPQTFMNNSGQAVFACQKFFKISLEEIAVIYDDLDLPSGKARFRISGGHGGHNGIRSMIEHLGSNEFKRVRLGIGRPPEGTVPRNYVLSDWRKTDLEKFEKIQNEVLEQLIRFIDDSIFEASSFNVNNC